MQLSKLAIFLSIDYSGGNTVDAVLPDYRASCKEI